jgi:hypothetical protein
MKTRKSIALITVAVVAAALIVTGLAIVLLQAANKNSTAGSTGLTIDQAATAAQNYLNQLGNPNLAVSNTQEYSNMFYAQVVEKSNGTGAFELAVDKTTGAVTPMQGPTLMWDTKYGVGSTGMMGYLTGTGTSGRGMMGGGGMMTWLRGTPTTNMAVSMEQARATAQEYLDANYTGTSVGRATTYYGYYTMQITRNGTVVGMMGVYGTTGQVMYYSWLGTFMQEKMFP